jgi:hypothetical protein
MILADRYVTQNAFFVFFLDARYTGSSASPRPQGGHHGLFLEFHKSILAPCTNFHIQSSGWTLKYYVTLLISVVQKHQAATVAMAKIVGYVNEVATALDSIAYFFDLLSIICPKKLQSSVSCLAIVSAFTSRND